MTGFGWYPGKDGEEGGCRPLPASAFPSIPAVGEPWWEGGPSRCCDEDYGGSHYHCGACGKVSSMMGHYMGGFRHNGKWYKLDPGYQSCQPEYAEAVEARKRELGLV